MTDRGTKLERAEESLLRAEEALARNIGNPTEEDWRAAVERYQERVVSLQPTGRPERVAERLGRSGISRSPY